MNDTPDTTAPKVGRGGRQIPRTKMYIFFAVFFLFAVTMYATTWNRIRTDGFMGTGNDQLAHPKAAQPEAFKPETGAAQ